MRNEPGAQPLAGIKVLDSSRVLAGPWCAMVLADLGAEVIKIEHPRRGDDTRDWGLRVGDTETTYFNSVNRSKRSICVDLQTQAGRRIARELAAQADVVVHNFKAGGAEKLGLGYDALAALNPRLVHCAISGYDRSGPEAGRPGYDLVVQGEAGLMALNGEAGRPPLKFGVAVADLFTGMYSAQAILAALYERHATGRGRRIEMALFDCGLMVTSYYGLEALLMGEDPPRYGNAHPSIVPYGVFDAADGPIVITVGNNPQFARFCDVIGRPELAADARFATNIARSANRAALLPEILRELGRRPRAARRACPTCAPARIRPPQRTAPAPASPSPARAQTARRGHIRAHPGTSRRIGARGRSGRIDCEAGYLRSADDPGRRPRAGAIVVHDAAPVRGCRDDADASRLSRRSPRFVGAWLRRGAESSTSARRRAVARRCGKRRSPGSAQTSACSGDGESRRAAAAIRRASARRLRPRWSDCRLARARRAFRAERRAGPRTA